MARPRADIDLAELQKLAEMQCTLEECAGFFGVSDDTINRRLKEAGYEGFAGFFKVHGAAGRSSLRRAQWRAALDGNPTMMVWLGKNMLGQTDKQEVSGNISIGLSQDFGGV